MKILHIIFSLMFILVSFANSQGTSSENSTFEQKVLIPSNNLPLIEMVYVEGGTFMMGDTWGDGYADQKPPHQVKVNSFFISKYEITQDQYYKVTGERPFFWTGTNLPAKI